MDWFSITLTWYLTSTLIMVAIAPLTLWLCRGLTDRGASIARPISSLVLIWPVWFLAGIGSGIVPFDRTSLWVSLAVIGVASWALGWRAGIIDRTAIKHLLIAEVGFLTFFALFIWFHGFGPQINEQEKPGDLMMLASSMRSTSMPPTDAWLAGNTINYYYLGYVVLAAIANLSGALPWEAFNLGLATVFAMTAVAAAGLVGNVVSRWWGERIGRVAGVLGMLFAIIIGNPWSAFTALGNWSVQWTSFFFGGIGWEATRFVRDVPAPAASNIAEFPAFSFVLGDLHPHLLALPFAIVALTLAWNFAQRAIPSTVGVQTKQCITPNESASVVAAMNAASTSSNVSATRRFDSVLVAQIVLSGAIVGVLYAMNSWDLPTYLLVTILGLLVGFAGYSWRDRLLGAALLVVSAVVPWVPFYANFEAPTNQSLSGPFSAFSSLPVFGGILASIVGYSGDRTSAGEFLGVFGFFWLIAVVLIAVEFWNRRHAAVDPLNQKFAMAAAVILLFGAILIPAPVLALAGLPLIAAVVLFQRDPRMNAGNVALGLFSVGFVISIVPEFFYLGDIFNSRMNTIFKLYYQAWLLLAVGAAISVFVIWQTLRPLLSVRVATVVVTAGTAIILALGFVYPVVGAKQWLDWRNPTREWSGVDGIAYLDNPLQSWSSPGEADALTWLWNNASSDDTLLSASGCEWQVDIGYPASASGVPSILGWEGHELQWHLADPEIGAILEERIADVNALFTQPTTDLLDKYGITLIYLGEAETNGPVSSSLQPGSRCAPGPFANANNPEFPGAGWTEAYNAEGVRIYRRDGS